MDRRTFEEAVRRALRWRNAMESTLKSEAEMVAQSHRTAVSSGATYRLALLIERSKGNRNIWDGLNLIAQETLRRREPLPDDLALWVAGVLDGEQPRPKLRGARRSAGQLASGSSKFLQHHLIVTAIDILATKGYRPTRRDYYTHGETCCPGGGSVFDAVGVAFGKPDRSARLQEGRGSLDRIHETREAQRTPARPSAPGTSRRKKKTTRGGCYREPARRRSRRSKSTTTRSGCPKRTRRKLGSHLDAGRLQSGS